jgi:dynein heavy chain
MDEYALLMGALRDFNIPKIVTDDKPIFLRLIDDLFPKLNPKKKEDLDLKNNAIKTTKADMGYIADELFVLKVV